MNSFAKQFKNMRQIKINTLLFLSIVCFGLVACRQTASTTQSTIDPEIYKVLTAQVEAWNKGDIKGFMEGYEKSDSLQFITRKGRTMGWQRVSDNYTKHYPTTKEMGHLNFKNLIVKNLSHSLAQVYGNWELLKDSTVGGNFSLMLKHKPEGWKIIIDHTW
jgi:hypothetical protein